LGGCATPTSTLEPSTRAASDWSAAEPEEILGAFVSAARGRDFETVWTLLASPLRARYSPETLARDFEQVGQGALEGLARAEIAGRREPQRSGDRARFELAEGRAVELVREADGWKVESLE